jgi:hypothetical protein
LDHDNSSKIGDDSAEKIISTNNNDEDDAPPDSQDLAEESFEEIHKEDASDFHADDVIVDATVISDDIKNENDLPVEAHEILKCSSTHSLQEVESKVDVELHENKVEVEEVKLEQQSQLDKSQDESSVADDSNLDKSLSDVISELENKIENVNEKEEHTAQSSAVAPEEILVKEEEDKEELKCDEEIEIMQSVKLVSALASSSSLPFIAREQTPPLSPNADHGEQGKDEEDLEKNVNETLRACAESIDNVENLADQEKKVLNE